MRFGFIQSVRRSGIYQFSLNYISFIVDSPLKYVIGLIMTGCKIHFILRLKGLLLNIVNAKSQKDKMNEDKFRIVA